MVQRAIAQSVIECAVQNPENQWLVPHSNENRNKKAASVAASFRCVPDSANFLLFEDFLELPAADAQRV
jgi:hypothetical protein